MDRLPDRYAPVIGPLIEHARTLLEEGQELAPVAFVGSSQRREMHSVLLDTHDERAKENSVLTLRALAHEMSADFVFSIMEVWSMRADQANYEDVIAQYGSIGASPYAVEVVMFYLETREGIWHAQCGIEARDETGARRLSEDVRFELACGIGGRMTRFLPPINPDGSPPTMQ